MGSIPAVLWSFFRGRKRPCLECVSFLLAMGSNPEASHAGCVWPPPVVPMLCSSRPVPGLSFSSPPAFPTCWKSGTNVGPVCSIPSRANGHLSRDWWWKSMSGPTARVKSSAHLIMPPFFPSPRKPLTKDTARLPSPLRILI